MTQQNFQTNTQAPAASVNPVVQTVPVSQQASTVAGTTGAATVGGIAAAVAANAIVVANPEYAPFQEYIQVGIFSFLAGFYRFFAPLGNALMGRAVRAVQVQ